MTDEQLGLSSPPATSVSERFLIDARSSDHEHTLALSGELDFAYSASFENAVRRACAPGLGALLLDLSALEFMDSSGLRVVLLAEDLCEQQGVELVIVPGTPQVQRIFEVTGFLATLPFRE